MTRLTFFFFFFFFSFVGGGGGGGGVGGLGAGSEKIGCSSNIILHNLKMFGLNSFYSMRILKQ